MEGPLAANNFVSDDPDIGVIPRSMLEAFKLSQEMALDGWKFEIDVSALEIYGDSIFDLTRTEKVALNTNERGGKITVENLAVHRVLTAKEAMEIIVQARKQRNIAPTTKNVASSRSHSIYILKTSFKKPRAKVSRLR